MLVVVLVIFGPEAAAGSRALARDAGMREFKDSVTGKDNDEVPEAQGDAEKPEPDAPPRRPASRSPSRGGPA